MAANPRIEELRRRVQKDPTSIAFAQLAEECRRAGDYDEAIRICRTGLQTHPSYLSARVTLGRALVEVHELDQAMTELRYVLQHAAENLAAIRAMAEIHHRRGELSDALRYYKSALELARHDPDLEQTVEEISRAVSPVPAPVAGPGLSFAQASAEFLLSEPDGLQHPPAIKVAPPMPSMAGPAIEKPVMAKPAIEMPPIGKAPIEKPAIETSPIETPPIEMPVIQSAPMTREPVKTVEEFSRAVAPAPAVSLSPAQASAELLFAEFDELELETAAQDVLPVRMAPIEMPSIDLPRIALPPIDLSSMERVPKARAPLTPLTVDAPVSPVLPGLERFLKVIHTYRQRRAV